MDLLFVVRSIVRSIVRSVVRSVVTESVPESILLFTDLDFYDCFCDRRLNYSKDKFQRQASK